MPDPTVSAQETSEEVLEAEIQELEKRTLNSGWLWVAAAVGLVILAGAAFIVTSWDNRSQAGRSLAFTPEPIALNEPRGTVSDVTAFRWDPVDAASTYIVMVKEADRDEVELLRPVRENFLQPSDSESSDLLPGAYTWSVEARSRRGTLIGYGESTFVVAKAPE
jgi:hypothetical protein